MIKTIEMIRVIHTKDLQKRSAEESCPLCKVSVTDALMGEGSRVEGHERDDLSPEPHVSHSASHAESERSFERSERRDELSCGGELELELELEFEARHQMTEAYSAARAA